MKFLDQNGSYLSPFPQTHLFKHSWNNFHWYSLAVTDSSILAKHTQKSAEYSGYGAQGQKGVCVQWNTAKSTIPKLSVKIQKYDDNSQVPVLSDQIIHLCQKCQVTSSKSHHQL